MTVPQFTAAIIGGHLGFPMIYSLNNVINGLKGFIDPKNLCRHQNHNPIYITQSKLE